MTKSSYFTRRTAADGYPRASRLEKSSVAARTTIRNGPHLDTGSHGLPQVVHGAQSGRSSCTSRARNIGTASRGILLHVAGKLFEGIAIDDLDVSSVSASQDSTRRERSERPTHRRKCGTNVFGDIRAIHRNVYFVPRSAIGGLKLLKHLKEHGQLRKRASAREQERMTLRLAQLVA